MMRRLPRFLLRRLPRLLLAVAFSAGMLQLLDCCSHWTYTALFIAMFGSMMTMVVATLGVEGLLDRWLDRREARQNDKGPASPGP